MSDPTNKAPPAPPTIEDALADANAKVAALTGNLTTLVERFTALEKSLSDRIGTIEREHMERINSLGAGVKHLYDSGAVMSETTVALLKAHGLWTE